jgi:hypothetical protein
MMDRRLEEGGHIAVRSSWIVVGRFSFYGSTVALVCGTVRDLSEDIYQRNFKEADVNIRGTRATCPFRLMRVEPQA